MPEQRYTIGEAVSLLDVDRVTLARWLAVENMTPQSDPRDKRIRYLTREQILELARVHGKIIRDETSIGPRLTGVQRDMVERIQQLEETKAELLASRQHQEEVIAALLARINSLERALRATGWRESVPTPSEYVEDIQPPETHYRPLAAYHGARLRPGEWRTLPPIPDGWVTPRRMAEELGVPTRSFMHALRPRDDHDRERYGTLEYHAGRWQAPHRGTFASELLDPEQQEAARARFAPRGQ